MDQAEYDQQLYLLLGVRGPMGIMRCDDQSFLLVYKLPDGGEIMLPPASTMRPEQRLENIEGLREHLGLIAKNRKPATAIDQ